MATIMRASASPVAARLAACAKVILIRSIVARRLLAAFLLCATMLSSAADLPSGQGLGPGQGIYSDNGQYLLLMQSDGNLVYYRVSDGAVRWHTNTWGTPGAVLAMQGDGNAVTYYSPPIIPAGKGDGYAKPQLQQTYATWYSATAGNPGAYMKAQNDGNLVVVAANGQLLWYIGSDPDLNKPDPKYPGDVVGRELVSTNGIIRVLGHLAFSDGSNLYQVMNQPLVVQYVTVANFKETVAAQGATAYWGTASPNIPLFYLLGCYETNCSEGAKNQVLSSRKAMAARALQIYSIGATYTLSTDFIRAVPKRDSYPLRRGNYRCDTFVLDIYDMNASVYTDASGKFVSMAADVARWVDFRDLILRVNILPSTIFHSLKNFRG